MRVTVPVSFNYSKYCDLYFTANIFFIEQRPTKTRGKIPTTRFKSREVEKRAEHTGDVGEEEEEEEERPRPRHFPRKRK